MCCGFGGFQTNSRLWLDCMSYFLSPFLVSVGEVFEVDFPFGLSSCVYPVWVKGLVLSPSILCWIVKAIRSLVEIIALVSSDQCYNCGLVHYHSCSSRKIMKAALALNPNKPHCLCDSCFAKLNNLTMQLNASYGTMTGIYRSYIHQVIAHMLIYMLVVSAYNISDPVLC